MSQIALDTVKAIREHLREIIVDLDGMEGALKNAPLGIIKEPEMPKEELNKLSWKPYKSGSGEWIFSNLEEPTAKSLRESLAKNNGRLKLHGVTYRFSGKDNKFVSRYPG